MRTKTLFSGLAVSAAFVLAAAAVHAAPQSVVFPIAELGGCTDQASCHAYCDQEANHATCESFAQAHGFSSGADASAAAPGQEGEAGAAIAEDGGPGQCGKGAKDPANACRAYCDQTAHIQECVSYGKTHNLIVGDDLQEAQKVAAALEGGVTLPTGCTSAASCKQVCENPKSIDQAKSCFSFAKAAGLLPPGFDEEKAQKVFQAIQSGDAPFKSPKDFAQCENSTDPSVIEKCTDFAVKSGLLTEQEAQVVKATGGKGPGGCQGKDACDAYCSAHQDECFQFAKDHNLLTQDNVEHMRDSASHLKEVLDKAPDAVKQCITDTVGQDKLAGMLSGDTPPGQDFAAAAQNCFGKLMQQQGNDRGGLFGNFGPHDSSSTPPSSGQGEGDHGQQQGLEGPDNGQGMSGGQFPPQVASCLADKVGSDTVANLAQQPGELSGDIAEAVRECYSENFGEHAPPPPESKRTPPPGFTGDSSEHGPSGSDNENGRHMPPPNARGQYQPGMYGSTTMMRDGEGQYPRPEGGDGQEQGHPGMMPPPGTQNTAVPAGSSAFPTPPPDSTQMPPPPPPAPAATTSGLTSFLNALNPATIVANVLWAIQGMH